MTTILIRNGRIVRDSKVEQSDVLIEDGTLTRVDTALPENADEVIDATGLLIFPGLIDCHVHFREPGHEDAEDMQSGSASARSGGVTTVCEMPNTNPPTCTREALNAKLERAKNIKDCDIRFFFGVAKREHLEELKKVNRDDVCGVKLYLGQSTGNQKVESDVTEEVFKTCAEIGLPAGQAGLPLVCHCENEEIIKQNEGIKNQESGIRNHSEIRSVEAAVKATTYAIELAAKHGTKLHIAHVSTADEIKLIAQAKSNGINVTCEVAPHHLFLSVDDYESLGALAKMNPPLRTKDHCSALINAAHDGTIDCIATDHAPHTLRSKQTDNPLDAPSGVPGVETMLPLLLTNGFTPEEICRLCHTNPNTIFSLGKANISPGKHVSLSLVNPSESWVIHGKELKSRCGWTPYEGLSVLGKVVRTLI